MESSIARPTQKKKKKKKKKKKNLQPWLFSSNKIPMNFGYTNFEKLKPHESMLNLTLHLLEHVFSRFSSYELIDL